MADTGIGVFAEPVMDSGELAGRIAQRWDFLVAADKVEHPLTKILG